MIGFIAQTLAGVLFGALLGGFFFGGLWWSIRHLTVSTRPTVLMVSSFVIRFGVVLLGFYLLTAWRPAAFLFALVGFFLARQATSRWVRHPARSQNA